MILMEMNFCRRCGAVLSPVNDLTFTCGNGHTIFAISAPAVGVFLLTKEHEVLLSVRGIEPHKGMLDALGGFLDHEETTQDALVRELKEELGLVPSEYSPPEFLTSAVGYYPYGGEVVPVISTFFWAYLETTRAITPADDVAAIKQIPLHQIPLEQLHDDDIRVGIAKLQELFPEQ
jgi:NAD+ diphosphatase